MSRLAKAVTILLVWRTFCKVVDDSSMAMDCVSAVGTIVVFLSLDCLELVRSCAAASPTVNIAAPEMTFLRTTAAAAAAESSAEGLMASTAQYCIVRSKSFWLLCFQFVVVSDGEDENNSTVRRSERVDVETRLGFGLGAFRLLFSEVRIDDVLKFISNIR